MGCELEPITKSKGEVEAQGGCTRERKAPPTLIFYLPWFSLERGHKFPRGVNDMK